MSAQYIQDLEVTNRELPTNRCTDLVSQVVSVDSERLIYVITVWNYANSDIVGTDGKRFDHTLHKLGQVVKTHWGNARGTIKQKHNLRRIISTCVDKSCGIINVQ